MEHPTSIIENRDYLFEEIESDINGDRGLFDEKIDSLCETGYLEGCLCPSDDSVMYKAKAGLKWSTLVELADPIKKKIMLQLIENPTCFFVLFNTQKGKLRIIGKEISSWRELPNKRPVGFLVSDNDRTLSGQSVNGVFSCFPIVPGYEASTDPNEKYAVSIFELSSNNKISLRDIITYIDAYAFNTTYKMPLIVALCNNKQIEKLVRIISHVLHHPSPTLCIGGGWDEADKTYPQFREKAFQLDGRSTTFKELLNHPSERLFRNGFVTATEGDLLDEDYEECANAYHYPVEINPEDTTNYFSFHHPESKVHHIKVKSRESNNTIAERILHENWPTHFSKPLKLRNGELYHHKIIVNSDVKADEMRRFANGLRPLANAIVFNMVGVKVFLENGTEKTYSARKQNLNRLLFYIYKINNLDTRPLVIIGRRKVDRGLGFHYAPRRSNNPLLEIDGKDGKIYTDGIEGLIWTDMIMGNKIEHIPSAVQKAGRGAGIIRQCPQYPEEFHYWIDIDTSDHIVHHYKKVDKVNELRGTNSMLQAITHAEAETPRIHRNHQVDPNTFCVIRGESPEQTLGFIKDIVKNIFGQSFRMPNRVDGDDRFFATSLNNESGKVSLFEAVKKVPGAYGTNGGVKTYRRFLSSYKDLNDENSLHCVIPLIDPAYTQQMKDDIRARFTRYIVDVPQEGVF